MVRKATGRQSTPYYAEKGPCSSGENDTASECDDGPRAEQVRSVNWTALDTAADSTVLPDSDTRQIYLRLGKDAVEQRGAAVPGLYSNVPRMEEGLAEVGLISSFVLLLPV